MSEIDNIALLIENMRRQSHAMEYEEAQYILDKIKEELTRKIEPNKKKLTVLSKKNNKKGNTQIFPNIGAKYHKRQIAGIISFIYLTKHYENNYYIYILFFASSHFLLIRDYSTRVCRLRKFFLFPLPPLDFARHVASVLLRTLYPAQPTQHLAYKVRYSCPV